MNGRTRAYFVLTDGTEVAVKDVTAGMVGRLYAPDETPIDPYDVIVTSDAIPKGPHEDGQGPRWRFDALPHSPEEWPEGAWDDLEVHNPYVGERSDLSRDEPMTSEEIISAYRAIVSPGSAK